MNTSNGYALLQILRAENFISALMIMVMSAVLRTLINLAKIFRIKSVIQWD